MGIGLMFARIMALCIGAAIIFLLRFRVFKRGFSPSVSALMAAAAMADFFMKQPSCCEELRDMPCQRRI